MIAEKARLTLDLTRDMHERLKVLAAKKRTSMREYCMQAIARRIAEEPAEYLTARTDPVLAELWDNDDDAVYDDL